MGPSNGMPFSTNDNDNDGSPTVCTQRYYGAWWYNGHNACTETNLNGIFFTKTEVDDGIDTVLSRGVTWNSWRGYYYSLKRVEMKVRRV